MALHDRGERAAHHAGWPDARAARQGELSPGHLLGEKPAQTYDIGCQVGLRVAGVIASKAVGRSLAHSREMCPLGLIVVLDKSVEEWIVHPDGAGQAELSLVDGYLDGAGLETLSLEMVQAELAAIRREQNTAGTELSRASTPQPSAMQGGRAHQ